MQKETEDTEDTKMKKRVLTSVGIVITLILFFVLKTVVSDYFFDILIFGMGVFASIEASKIFSKAGVFNNIILSTSFPFLLFIANLLGIYYSLAIWIIILINISLIIFMGLISFLWSLISKRTIDEIRIRGLNCKKAKFSLLKSCGNIACFVYPSLFIMSMMFLNHFDSLDFENIQSFNGNLSIIILLLAFLIPIFTDTFAMLTGMLIGGKKLCPKLSPKKTISGAVGGTLWCVLFLACIYLILNATDMFYDTFISGGLPIWVFLLVGIFGSVVAQAGDLFESFLKRKANVKDSGRILPGHGGMLDRIDSYIFVAPYLFLAFVLVALI